VRHGTGHEIVKTFASGRFAPRFMTGKGPASGHLSSGAGHLRQFHELILPHLDGAYNLARYLTRDPVLSEDAVQDAMLRAFRSFAQFRGASPRAWLFAIVRNCCRTAQSQASGRVALVVNESSLGDDIAIDAQPDPGPSPEEEVLRKADVARVRAAIEAMPEPFREAVVLREFEDLSYAEVAEVTGVPIGTVMSRLARGRAMLAKELLPPAKLDDEQSRSVK
jgi:RNA polymerase sigma factor (sigma-70 family)